MTNNLIDFYNHILKYNNKSVYIAFSTKDAKPYFHGKQLCDLLEYKDHRDALRNNVDKNDIVYLKDIVDNYKQLYKNVQGHTKFINEAGLYSLIIISKNKKAKDIQYWITHEVMPSIREFGEYKLKHHLKEQINGLNKALDKLRKENEILKHNLKVKKYKPGDVIYILRVIIDTMDLDSDEIIYVKVGRSKDLNTRLPQYWTCNKNKVQVLKTVYVTDAKNIEKCAIVRLAKFQIKNRKEFFECSYNDVIKEIANCVKFYEHYDIDIKPDHIITNNEKIKRSNTKFDQITNFDPNKKISIRFQNDDKYCDFSNLNKLDNLDDLENISSGGSSSNCDFDTNDLYSDLESDNVDDNQNNDENQNGGNNQYYMKYIIFKKKYLSIKFDLL